MINYQTVLNYHVFRVRNDQTGPHDIILILIGLVALFFCFRYRYYGC